MTFSGRQNGLTLVELLVVLVILGLAASVVLMNAPPSRPAAKAEAEMFAARLQLAREEALFNGAIVRAVVDGGGYVFERKRADGWERMTPAKMFGRRDFSGGVAAAVTIDDPSMKNVEALGGPRGEKKEDGVHEIRIDPFGVQPVFALRLSAREGAFAVRHDAAGAIRVSRD